MEQYNYLAEAPHTSVSPAFRLLGLYTNYVTFYRGLAGVLVADRAIRGVEGMQSRLTEFLKVHLVVDLAAHDFSTEWGHLFLTWLRESCRYQHSTAVKHMTTLSRVLRWGVERELIEVNTLACFDFKRPEPKDLVHLNADELRHLSQLRLSLPSLARVRDCFVFQCWTGFSYADLSKFDAVKQVDRHSYRRRVRVQRSRSTMYKGYECRVPLLAEAERILAKYADVLPVPTNQVYNRYLKRIAELAELGEKTLTAQVGRNTAGIQLFRAGVQPELVSKMLGHSSAKQTLRLFSGFVDESAIKQRRKGLELEYGLADVQSSDLSREQTKLNLEKLEKLEITFGFLARPATIKHQQALKQVMGVDYLEPSSAGVLRAILDVRGRDVVKFLTPYPVVRGWWDTKRQRAVGGNIQEIEQQTAALRSQLRQLYLGMIERKQKLTAGALLLAYRHSQGNNQ